MMECIKFMNVYDAYHNQGDQAALTVIHGSSSDKLINELSSLISGRRPSYKPVCRLILAELRQRLYKRK